MSDQLTAADRQVQSARSIAALAQRWVVTTHMLALAAQVLFALLLLGGFAVVQLHSSNAGVVLALGALQAIVAVASWPPGGSLWKVAAVIVPLLEAAQIYLGRAGDLATHVTLGVILWGLALALLIQVWAPSWGRQLSRA